MKIGLFDSGLGGMVVLEAFKRQFPTLDIILEMDRKNAPYGDRDSEEIRSLTCVGVKKLFDRGADVVILACNTASVHALRWLQQEIFPHKKILGVTVPGAEKVMEVGYKKIGVLATEATVKIRGYQDRVHILDTSIHVEEVGSQGLVPLIESGIVEGSEIDDILELYISQFSSDIEAIVLGCTHYPLVQDAIIGAWKRIHSTSVPDIVDPGEEAARKFAIWMKNKSLS